MALDVILLKTPYSVAFTGNPMPFAFALAPYGDTERAQVILLQVRVLIEDTYGTNVFTEIHSQNIYPDNNGMVSLDVRTLIDPYLKWFLPKPDMPSGTIKEATEQRKRYKLSYLLQQNSEVIGVTQETGLFLAVKGGLSYESWKPIDFFNQAEDGQPLHFPVAKNAVLPDQPLFFWWLMPDVPESTCIPVTIDPVQLADADTSIEYDEYIYVHGSAPITITQIIIPDGLDWVFDGSAVHLFGYATTPETGALVKFVFSNCSGVTATFEDHIDITGCVPLTIPSGAFPDATVGVPYEHFVYFTGSDTTGAVNPSLPQWMNYMPQNSQHRIRFYGTPSSGDIGQGNVFVGFTNCSGATAYVNEFINVNANNGTGVVFDDDTPSFTGQLGNNVSYQIPFTGTGPVSITSFTGVAAGYLSAEIVMDADNETGIVLLEGVLEAVSDGDDFVLVISNAGGSDTANGTVLVTAGSGGGNGRTITYNDDTNNNTQHVSTAKITSTWKLNGVTKHSGGIFPNSNAPFTTSASDLIAGTTYDVTVESDEKIQVFITQGGTSKKFVFSDGIAHSTFTITGSGNITIQ